MSEHLKPNQKKCPKCGLICGINTIRCPQCKHEFLPEDMPNNTPKSDNPKAPKKTCPECGARVYISRTHCDQCNHRFVSKKEKELLENQSKMSNKAPKKSKGNRPAKALRNVSISLIAYSVILIIVMSILIRQVSPFWFATISSLTTVISLVVGAIFAVVFENGYGKASIRPFNVYTVVLILGMCAVDFLYFYKGISAYSGELKWGMGAMAVSISVCIVTTLIALRIGLKSDYCPYCDRTNSLVFSHDQNEKEIYGYKFETHKAHTETARITSDRYGDTDISIRYKVPEYQENLGLHKYTTKESVHMCENCGRTVIRNHSHTEKVDM